MRTVLITGIAYLLIGLAAWTGIDAFLDGKNHFERIDERDREEDRALFEWLKSRGYRPTENGRAVAWEEIQDKRLDEITVEFPRVILETEDATYEFDVSADDLERIEKEARRKEELVDRKYHALTDRLIAGFVGTISLLLSIALYRFDLEYRADEDGPRPKNGREEYVVFGD